MSEDSNNSMITAIEAEYGSDAYMLIVRKREQPHQVGATIVGPRCEVAIGKVSADDAISMLYAMLSTMQTVYGHALTDVALASAVLAYSTVDDILHAANSLTEKQKVVHG